uniref:Migration and invasion-inhibitory protein n=1 Tax=Geotrypetes seraphini TaxID=260995 RepID=A0A6P8P4U9_GEOSA|nr:migration and invasion-inhibitory protein [Geotrypetes seraphini]XP_033778664.1 migration and invasion-inhibitory protein [Geotrypetes seraphini]
MSEFERLQKLRLENKKLLERLKVKQGEFGEKAPGKKEAGCAAFMSSSKEGLVPPDSLSVRPLLGYDWIAGLLDMDSSLWEKSEQYFSDLHEFRQINQDECVQELLESEKLDISADEHKEDSLSSHLCVYCYRVNKRLFLNPSSESCPICKTKRNQQHRTLGEERLYQGQLSQVHSSSSL